MTDFDRVRLRNRAYEAMLDAQEAMDHAPSDTVYQIFRAIYNANNAAWLMLVELERRDKNGK